MRPLLLSTFDSVRQTLIHYKAIHHKDTKPQKLFQIFVTCAFVVICITTDFTVLTKDATDHVECAATESNRT